MSYILEKSKRAAEREPEVEKEKKLVIRSQPKLDEGVNLLHKPEKLPVFQAVLANYLENRNSSAVWIDVGNESSTYALSSYGKPGILEKVKIGRAFTPFQYHSLIHQLEDDIQEDTELLVLPNITSIYLEGQIKEWEAEELFEEVWSKILQLQLKHDLKVLVSVSSTRSSLNYIVNADTDNRIKVESTSRGWKYDSDGFDQLIYQENGLVQTTVSYWNRKNSENVEIVANQV